jgi:hypothetical protein
VQSAATGSVLVTSVSSGHCTTFEHCQSLREFSDIFLFFLPFVVFGIETKYSVIMVKFLPSFVEFQGNIL